MTERERMLAGRLYIARGEEIGADFMRARKLVEAFNRAGCDDFEGRGALLRELLGAFGEGGAIVPPFHCDYGKHIFIGKRFMANYDCIMLDVCPITIATTCSSGRAWGCTPRRIPSTPACAAKGWSTARRLSSATASGWAATSWVNPGVTIGDGAVIGSGSVVTRDIPANVVAAGVPCRVLREIGDADRDYWRALRDEYRAWEAGR